MHEIENLNINLTMNEDIRKKKEKRKRKGLKESVQTQVTLDIYFLNFISIKTSCVLMKNIRINKDKDKNKISRNKYLGQKDPKAGGSEKELEKKGAETPCDSTWSP